MNELLLRRRIMLDSIKKSLLRGYYPLIVNTWTDDELIDMYGDLFETFKKAPNQLQSGTVTYYKAWGCAVSKSFQSISIGNKANVIIRYYEDGTYMQQSPTSSPYTFTKISTENKFKHFVFYLREGSSGNLSGATFNGMWVITSDYVYPSNLIATQWGNTVGINVRQFHYHKNLTRLWWNTGFNRRFPSFNAKTTDSYLWFPDITRGIMSIPGGNVKKIRFPKSATFISSTYWMYNITPTDFYVHWGLEDTIPNITAGGNMLGSNCKLHIPDLGDADLNNQLKQQYISRGWTTAKFVKGIFNDVETTELPAPEPI